MSARSATAAEYSNVDPQDAPARADIRAYSVTHGSTIKLAAKVRKPSNPITSQHWIQGFSNMDWEIDVGGSPTQEYFAVMSNSNGKLRAIVDLVSQSTPPAVCGKAEGVKPSFQNGRYKIKFPRSCIGNPASIQVQPFMFSDRQPYLAGHGPEDPTDSAPSPLKSRSAERRLTPRLGVWRRREGQRPPRGGRCPRRRP